MDPADGWLGLTDGGNGRADRREENCPWVWAVLLACFHPAQRRTGLARLLYPSDEARAEAPAATPAREWCRLLKPAGYEEGGPC